MDDLEAPTHGRCSSSDHPRWTETNELHSVASASTETGEQPATSQTHQQEVELLKLPSSQHSAGADKDALRHWQQEHQQELQRPVLLGQQLRAGSSGDGPVASSGPPGLVGEFSGDSASSVSGDYSGLFCCRPSGSRQPPEEAALAGAGARQATPSSWQAPSRQLSGGRRVQQKSLPRQGLSEEVLLDVEEKCWWCLWGNVSAAKSVRTSTEPSLRDQATILCLSQSVASPQLHLRRFALTATSIPGSRVSAWPNLLATACWSGSICENFSLSELTVGHLYWAGSQPGTCSLLQASTVPGGVPHQLQAADSGRDDQGQPLLPANGSEPAVPQRKWYRDRQILLCLAGTGLITLVSSRVCISTQIGCMFSIFGAAQCWPPAGLMRKQKQNPCTGPVQGATMSLTGDGPWSWCQGGGNGLRPSVQEPASTPFLCCRCTTCWLSWGLSWPAPPAAGGACRCVLRPSPCRSSLGGSCS